MFHPFSTFKFVTAATAERFKMQSYHKFRVSLGLKQDLITLFCVLEDDNHCVEVE